MAGLVPFNKLVVPKSWDNQWMAKILDLLEQSIGRYLVRPGEKNVKDSRFPPYNVRRYNAKLDGVTNDLAALTDAVSSLPLEGGVIDLDEGRMLLSGNPSALHAAINARRSVVLRGRGGAGWRGNNYPPTPFPSSIYCKGLTNYLWVKSGAVNEYFRIENVDIDASNGTGYPNGSTTCRGVINTNGVVTFYPGLKNCVVHGFYANDHDAITRVNGHAVLDLDGAVFPTLENCYFAQAHRGRLVYTGAGTTTFYARRCYFTSTREIYYHRDTIHARYEDCVFESAVVGGAQLRSKVTHENCHYENLGEANGAGGPYTTGITPRDHGYGGGYAVLLPGNVNTAFNQLHGTLVINNPTFNNLKLDTGVSILDAWFECLGVGASPGSGGTLVIREPYKGDAGLTDSLFADTMAFATSERGSDFTVVLDDAWGVAPTGAAIRKSDDARKVSFGRIRLEMNDGTTQLVTVKAGRFWYELQDVASRLAAAPTIWPRNDQGRIGDTIIRPVPASGGYIGLVCTAEAGAGTAGTWKDFGAIL